MDSLVSISWCVTIGPHSWQILYMEFSVRVELVNEIFAGRSTLVCQCVGVFLTTSLISLSPLLPGGDGDWR